jgi:hypothetical protein
VVITLNLQNLLLSPGSFLLHVWDMSLWQLCTSCNNSGNVYSVTDYCYGEQSFKASHATETIFWSIVLPIWALIVPDLSTRVFCSVCSRHLIAKRAETGRKMAAEFCLSVSYHNGQGADGFTFPPHEVLLQIFIVLENPSVGRVWTREPWVRWQAR